jgi:hypothetical protein
MQTRTPARLVSIAILTAAILLLLGSASAGARAERSPCASDIRGKCLVRPHHLFTGAHTWIRGIHWVKWSSQGALGYGRLVERAIYASFTGRARIRLGLPAECQGREWFFSTDASWGPGYRRPYLRESNYSPCA